MKIALLGAKAAGKTSYFAALYNDHTDNIVIEQPTGEERDKLLEAGVSHHVGFQFYATGKSVSDMAASAALLRKTPPEFPPRSTRFSRLNIGATFQFLRLLSGRVRTFSKSITLVDHAGGALDYSAEDSEKILAELDTADCFIAFIDAEVALEGDKATRNRQLALGGIDRLVSSLRERIEDIDVIPIVFVISKFDTVVTNAKKYRQLRDYIENDLIGPYSQKWGNVAIFTCPIAIVDPQTGHFKGFNLQWPFLFAAAATLLRNSLLLEARARRERAAARDMESEARDRERMLRERPFKRFWSWLKEDFKTANHWHKKARGYYAEAERSVEMSEEDRELAQALWKAIAEREEMIGARTYMNGKPVNVLEAID